MENCIYCGKEEANSNEHILQDSLGADWECKNILCETCNGLFGRTIDKVLADEFSFFRNFLSIRGKRGDVPSFKMKNELGQTVQRDGSSGEITTQNKPQIERHDNEDGTSVISVSAELARSGKIFADIQKGLERKGWKKVAIVANEYITHPMGPIRANFSFSLPTYIALRKSLINYWCYWRRKQELPSIEIEAKKIHDFATFCDTNNNMEERKKCADRLGISGYPLCVDISDPAKELMKEQMDIFNSIYLVSEGKKIYGGVCLFNEMQWGFKISDSTSINAQPLVTSINVRSRNLEKNPKYIHKNSIFSNSDFKFLQLENECRLQKNKEYFLKSADLCARMEHYISVKQIIEPGDIEKYFPITNQQVIEGIFLERTAIILGWVFASSRVKPEFFRSGKIGKSFPQVIVSSFFEQFGKNFVLTSESYRFFIDKCFEVAQNLANHSPGFAQFAQ